MFTDEFEIAQIRVGVTPDKKLNSFVQPLNYHGPPGFQVQGEDGLVQHYYTTQDRAAVICVTCKQGIAQQVRLGLGFWGALTELAEIPLEAISDCSLDVMGTSHMACLGTPEDGIFSGRPRVLQIYGPPTRETEDLLEYDWLFPPRPRKMWFRVQGDALVEMCLSLAEEKPVAAMRPLGPPVDFERLPRLPSGILAKMQEGEERLRSGQAAEAERLFGEVLAVLSEDDPFPNDLKVEVAARQSLAHLALGQRGAVERIEGLLQHLETYASYNPPEVLRTRLALGQAHRLAGNLVGARKELQKLWDLMQDSQYYREPEVQSLVRRTAAELELVGEASYAEEIRRLDGLN